VHCVRLDSCHHVFCEECVRTHAALHIKEGKLDALQCLEASCNERLSRQVLMMMLYQASAPALGRRLVPVVCPGVMCSCSMCSVMQLRRCYQRAKGWHKLLPHKLVHYVFR
jgi:hypothetical protein